MEEKRVLKNSCYLKKLLANDKDSIEILFNWEKQDLEKNHYTCRPIPEFSNFNDYFEYINMRLIDSKTDIYLLKNKKDEGSIFGKIFLFDYNQRNRSAEFGYYIPKEYRRQGLGKIMTQLFIDQSFNDKILELNKLYVTTASGNIASIKLLKRLGFQLDGIMREHYWIDDVMEDQLCFSILNREWL